MGKKSGEDKWGRKVGKINGENKINGEDKWGK